MKERIKRFLLTLLLSLITIQLSPIGLSNHYETFRLGIMVVTGALFLFSWNTKAIWRIDLFKYFVFVILIEMVFLGALFFVGANAEWEPISNLVMVFMFMLISFMDLSTRQYKWVLNLFVVGTLFSGISIIFTYGNGFVINDLYMPVPKNQIAPVLSTGFFVAFFCGNNTQKVKEKYIYWTMAFLLFVCICVFRARANMVAVILGLMIYFVFYKRKIFPLVLVGVCGILVLTLTPLGEFVYDAFFANYDVSDLNSLSAGRTDTYQASLRFIGDHWLLGALYSVRDTYHAGSVHNYVLYTLENYGFLGGGLLVYFYVRLLIEVIKKNVQNKMEGLYALGCFVFIVPLVVSFFEYTYPYAPGSAVFMSYFCLGQYYRNLLWKGRSCV